MFAFVYPFDRGMSYTYSDLNPMYTPIWGSTGKLSREDSHLSIHDRGMFYTYSRHCETHCLWGSTGKLSREDWVVVHKTLCDVFKWAYPKRKDDDRSGVHAGERTFVAAGVLIGVFARLWGFE